MLFCLPLLLSCISNRKVTYLQNIKNEQALLPDSLIRFSISNYVIKYKDILDVKIKTTVPEMNVLFGLEDPASKAAQLGSSNLPQGDIYYMNGYNVDSNGQIKLPFIGKVKLAGLSTDEAEEAISKKLSGFFKASSLENLYVRVKLGGIGFSTVGEFNKPGRYTILQERATIFDAIACSGDLTVQAKRDKIILIRQYPGGIKLHELNLNERSILTSPYYFIQPNDQIYASPLKTRELGAGNNVSRALQVLVSALSVAVIVIGFTR